MPYTNNKSEKFDEIVKQALAEIRTEANYSDDLTDAELSEANLQEEIKKSENEFWQNVEVSVTKYDLMEESLKTQEDQLQKVTQTSAKENPVSSRDPVREPQQASAIQSIRDDLQKLRNDIDTALLLAVKAQMRVTLNTKVKPNYDTQLKMTRAPGLAEVLDPTRTIDTDAKTSLLYMLNTMPGGSIGIAGSRGSGKTTLIQMCCGKKRIINEIQGQKVLPVLTSAPVQYDSRDFILYLFSAVCQRVLDPDDTQDVVTLPPEIDGFYEPPRQAPLVNFLLTATPRMLYKLAIILIGVSLLATIAVSLLTTFSSSGQPNLQSPPNPAQTTSPIPTPTATPPPVRSTRAFIEKSISLIEIKPGTLLTWGVFLFLSAYSLSLLARSYSDKSAFPRSYAEFAAASDSQRRYWSKKVYSSRLARWEQQIWNYDDRYNQSSGRIRSFLNSVELRAKRWLLRRPFFATKLGLTRVLSEYEHRFDYERSQSSLESRARHWLKETKFQQSFTSGWSGALKLPVGLEGGVNRAVTLAQRQLSNPEIVAAFVKFIEFVSKQYMIIIGIDELDKMESDEDARKFLNEIKSIFGLPNCFYLISVSENALSNFERRGLPLRDVFDSSFDNVVYVDYLNHRTAKDLLAGRIIGKPYPFIYLSYCLSGGLPRDLIRSFRNLLEFNQPAPGKTEGRDLADLGQAVIAADLRAKIRATAASAKKIQLEPQSSEFIEKLLQIESLKPTDSSMLATVSSLLKWPKSGTNGDRLTKAEAVTIKKIEELSKELGSYVFLLATLMRFFDNSLNEANLRKAAAQGDLEVLAKARQFMEVNPTTTVALLKQFRTRWEMPLPELDSH